MVTQWLEIPARLVVNDLGEAERVPDYLHGYNTEGFSGMYDGDADVFVVRVFAPAGQINSIRSEVGVRAVPLREVADRVSGEWGPDLSPGDVNDHHSVGVAV